jgi:hypothetical protein
MLFYRNNSFKEKNQEGGLIFLHLACLINKEKKADKESATVVFVAFSFFLQDYERLEAYTLT